MDIQHCKRRVVKDYSEMTKEFKWVCEGCLVQPSCSEICDEYIEQVQTIFFIVKSGTAKKSIKAFIEADVDAYQIMKKVIRNRHHLEVRNNQGVVQCKINWRGDRVVEDHRAPV